MQTLLYNNHYGQLLEITRHVTKNLGAVAGLGSDIKYEPILC